jgi:hypothetical protein
MFRAIVIKIGIVILAASIGIVATVFALSPIVWRLSGVVTTNEDGYFDVIFWTRLIFAIPYALLLLPIQIFTIAREIYRKKNSGITLPAFGLAVGLPVGLLWALILPVGTADIRYFLLTLGGAMFQSLTVFGFHSLANRFTHFPRQ